MTSHVTRIAKPGLAHPIEVASMVQLNPSTGEPIPAATRGGGALDANTQRVTLATDGPGVASLSSIDNKTPALVSGAVPTTDTQGGTRAFNWTNNVREAFTTSSTAAIALPTLGTSRELRVHTSVRAFIRFGASDVAAATVAAGQMISPADAPDVIRIPAGQTHCRVIGETASGSISLTAVV